MGCHASIMVHHPPRNNHHSVGASLRPQPTFSRTFCMSNICQTSHMIYTCDLAISQPSAAAFPSDWDTLHYLVEFQAAFQGTPCRWSRGGVLWHEDRALLLWLWGRWFSVQEPRVEFQAKLESVCGIGVVDTMPHFLPVQCSVLQILGPKWCCSMCRQPEIKVSAASESNVSDVTLFVEELNLPQEAEELEALANTFSGVESLDGVFSWEGLYFKSVKTQEENKWKCFTGIEICEEVVTKDDEGREDNLRNRRSDMAQKQGGYQHAQSLSSLWR